jgi:urate oxidase
MKMRLRMLSLKPVAIMGIKLGNNAYGKNAIKLSKITRHKDYHDFREISVNVALEGDFESAHIAGDNSNILATDTQKNTVYALAKEHFQSDIEGFAIYLAHFFHANNPQVSRVNIEISESSYKRISIDGIEHAHAFMGAGNEKRHTMISQSDSSITVRSGIKDLLIVKTTDSGFEHFIRDRYTTLKETSDRILATNCEVNWLYEDAGIDFNACFEMIHHTLIKTFSNHKSLSLQQTLYAMGEAVLQEVAPVKEISFKMPNKHHILFNLEQFGMENNNEIFISTDEPYGYITGTVLRDI